MTHNQIEYAKHLENVRHNTVSEQETERSNRATLSETSRHNVAFEQETHRSNVVNENEALRSHLAVETETHRSNVAKEQETQRSNIAKETETHRANLATELWRNQSLAETVRSNRASESLKAEQNAISRSSVAETARHNAQLESLQASANAINANNNIMRYAIDSEKNRISSRSVSATEKTNQLREKELPIKETQAWAAARNAAASSDKSKAEVAKINSDIAINEGLYNSRVFSNYSTGIGSILRSINPMRSLTH